MFTQVARELSRAEEQWGRRLKEVDEDWIRLDLTLVLINHTGGGGG